MELKFTRNMNLEFSDTVGECIKRLLYIKDPKN